MLPNIWYHGIPQYLDEPNTVYCQYGGHSTRIVIFVSTSYLVHFETLEF